jgi:hypothetical protein
MNIQTTILEQAQRRIGTAREKGTLAIARTRRCVCSVAMMLLILAVGAGCEPGGEARAQDSIPLNPNHLDYRLQLSTIIGPALVDNPAGADQDRMTARARFKTH